MKLTVLLCSALLLSFCGLSLQKNKCGDHDDCPEPKKPALEDILLPDELTYSSCEDSEGIHYCNFQYDPLCGSDGGTYRNRCELCMSNRFKINKVKVIYRGECHPVS
ncbi:serine protease inhibitor Kazal-type 6-like isoform X2 [Sebastes umbrosus]|uniref:serine protease inhibitor Kazal-type 6-like isoform X2 n=1 Tax=Sebastes umbrosus TaxID=72105 RepID=UPI00189E9AF3|nr:serine protease inhibitor Kazal-type 6-like isoform X2 [Sebastes umbrosus]